MRRLAFTVLPLLLTGCAMSPSAPPSASTGAPIKGTLHGGRQPIIGAQVYLLAANTTGYGGAGLPASSANASISLLTNTGHADALGAFVLTDAHGNFTITNDYTCTPSQQVYLYGIGGDPGSGPNSAASLMAILGTCPASGSFSAIPSVNVNEVTTIAAAYAFAGFATDPTHVSNSGTPPANTGIANAFANATNLVDLSTGSALAITPAGNGTVPQTTINTLANILAACVNTTGSTSTGCSNLFTNATVDGTSTGTQPKDTAAAAINIAHHPGTNIAALYGSPTPTAPFTPTLTAQPNDFTIGINFTGGGLIEPVQVAMDAAGSAWVTNNFFPGSVSKLSNTGSPLSPFYGYTGGGVYNPTFMAIDNLGNAWIANTNVPSVSKLSNSGSALSPSGGYTSDALDAPVSIAIDGSGTAWVADENPENISRLSSSGTTLSGPLGFTGGGLSQPESMAIDGSGSTWVTNYYPVLSKLSSSGIAISPSSGYTGGGLNSPTSIAVDGFGNVWVTNRNSLSHFANNGTALSPSTGYTGGGINYPTFVAIDGSGNAWIANNYPGTVSEFSTSGLALSPSTGYIGGQQNFHTSVAIDGSGNVWISNYGNFYQNEISSLTELIGVATPVITPICAGLPAIPTTDGSSLLGTRP